MYLIDLSRHNFLQWLFSTCPSTPFVTLTLKTMTVREKLRIITVKYSNVFYVRKMNVLAGK